MNKRHLLITGLPGTGKTTLLRRLAMRLAGLNPVGFLTEEIREGDIRQGFQLLSLDGRAGPSPMWGSAGETGWDATACM